MTTDRPLVIVDDSVDDLFFAKRAHRLSRLDLPLVCLKSGDAMLAWMRGTKNGKNDMPAVILLDINMPAMDGFSAYERMVTETRTESPPVWFLTGSDARSDIDRAKALGARGLLTKPDSVRSLARLLREVVQLASMEKAAEPYVTDSVHAHKAAAAASSSAAGMGASSAQSEK